MAKSSSAGSTPPTGQIDPIPLQALTELIRNPASGVQLSPSQITELMLRGVLFTLEKDGTPESINLLLEASRFSPNYEIRNQAIITLGKLAAHSNQKATDAIFYLAVFDQNQTAKQMIHSENYSAGEDDLQCAYLILNDRIPEYHHVDPEYVLLTSFFLNRASADLQEQILNACTRAGLKTWCLAVSAARNLSDQTIQSIHQHFSSIPDSERHLILSVLDRLAKSGEVLAKEEICRLFIDFEYAPARNLAIQQGYVPAAPVQAALFHFLAEQWQIYEYLDYNQSLLASAYENASPSLRLRILYLSRYSGRTEWMNGISSTSRQRWLWDMTDADWELAIRNLQSSENYPDLWKLAQVSSPVWAQKILILLSNIGWKPVSIEEQEGFLRLAELAHSLSGIKPPVSQLLTWPSPSPDITSMALSQDTSYLAVAGSNSTIHLWGIFKAPSPLPPIIGPVAQARSMCFSPDREFISVANGDNTIRVFRLADGKLVKSLEGHAGLVRSLAHSPDGRVLFSASFDGTIRAWRFPEGPEINRVQSTRNELFGLATSPDGQIILTSGSEPVVKVYRWPDASLLWQLSGHTNTVTTLVTAPRGQLAATAGRDGTIFLWNYIAGRAITHLPSEELMTSLAFHPNEQFLLGATAQGNILIWDISTGRKIESISAHRYAITGIALSPDGHQAYSASVDGFITVWDLQLFTWSNSPIGNNRSQTLAMVEQRLHHSAQKPTDRAWLQLIAELIRWRQRFDVEIEESHQVISVGDFDIEL